MSTEPKSLDDLLSQLSLLDVRCYWGLIDRSITLRHSEVRTLLEQNPSLASNIRSVFERQARNGLGIPVDTLSLAVLCADGRSDADGQAGDLEQSANLPPNPKLLGQTPEYMSAEDCESPIDNSGEEREPVNSSKEERRHASTKGKRVTKLRKPIAAAKSNEQSARRYQKAKATSWKAIKELGSPAILLRIQQDLTAARDIGFRVQPPKASHGVENASEQEIIDDICSIRCYFQELNADVILKTAKARYERSWIAELFYKYKACPEQWGGSLGVIFARAVLPKTRTEGCSTTALQSKWKCEMLKNKFWHQLQQVFGCGILSVLPDRLHDEYVRQLKPPDIGQFITDIHNMYPTLKNDLKGLSDMLASIVGFGVPLNRKLLLETLDEGEMRAKSFGELFSYCEMPLSYPHDAGAIVAGVEQSVAEPPAESLPSIHEFDQSIRALASKYGPARSST